MYGLLQQRMAERIAVAVPLGRDHQQPRRHQDRHRGICVDAGRGSHLPERLMLQVPPTGGGQRQQATPLVGQPVEAGQQHLTHGRRERTAQVHAGGQDLLHVEGIAIRSLVQPLRLDRRRLLTGDGARQAAYLRERQVPQIEPLDVVPAPHLGQPGPRGVPASEVVGADGHHDGDGLLAQRAHQEGRGREGARVGPVQILEGHHERAARGQAPQQLEECLVQSRLGPQLLLWRGFPVGDRRDQATQVPGRAARQGGQLGGAHAGGQGAQDLRVRREGQPRRSHQGAPSPQDQCPARVGELGRPGQQARLAHARFARDQNVPSHATARGGECLCKLGQLPCAPDHDAAGHPSGHGSDHTRAGAAGRRPRRPEDWRSRPGAVQGGQQARDGSAGALAGSGSAGAPSVRGLTPGTRGPPDQPMGLGLAAKRLDVRRCGQGQYVVVHRDASLGGSLRRPPHRSTRSD